jgi:carbamoyl-phosphate synthase large subunit
VVDTCAGEFPAETPYYYSSYESEDEVLPTDREKIVILGSGPNRIGQGIEFDYCCVQAVLALRGAGFETIMINSNPETVSTDFDVSDRLYFEPLTLEDVLEILDREKPKGVIVQLGGQTPLNLARGLEAEGIPILGTSVDAIDRAEDRRRFEKVCRKIGALVPPNGTATSLDEARAVAEVGYPVLVRPPTCWAAGEWRSSTTRAALEGVFRARHEGLAGSPGADRPLSSRMRSRPTWTPSPTARTCDRRDHAAHRGGRGALGRLGLRPAALPAGARGARADPRADAGLRARARGCRAPEHPVRDPDGVVYVLEVNPRASRTVPFVSKATGVPLSRAAARIMAGESMAELGIPSEPMVPGVAVKEAVLPFNRFDVDIILGPEMRSTGEVMGFDDHARDGVREGAGLGGEPPAARRGHPRRDRERQ